MGELMIRGRKLLPHWAEHLRDHAREIARWRAELGDASPSSVAVDVDRAERAMYEAAEALEAARRGLEPDAEDPQDG